MVATRISPETFFHHCLALEDQEEVAVNEVCQLIDWEQSSVSEKEALLALVTHMKTVAGEWEPMTNNGEIFGSFDKDGDTWFSGLLDLGEMSYDMNSWEDEFACHSLFAESPWPNRSTVMPPHMYLDSGEHPAVDKKSRTTLWTEVTNVGQTYITCESDYGKVFVPKHLMKSFKEGDMLRLRVQFKGFECARQTTLPWRALRILGESLHE